MESTNIGSKVYYWLKGTAAHQQPGGRPHLQHEAFTHSSDCEEMYMPSLNSPKRQNRGKHPSVACGQCKRRKIRCDEDVPCALCGIDCRRQAFDMRCRNATTNDMIRRSDVPVTALESDKSQENCRLAELSERLDQMEHRCSVPPLARSSSLERHDIIESESYRAAASFPEHSMPAELCSSTSAEDIELVQDQIPPFSGEMSIRHTLEQVETRLEEMDLTYRELRTASTIHASMPRPTSSLAQSAVSSSLSPNNIAPAGCAKDIHEVLYTHGITPDKSKWDEYMTIFCDEVHIMFPFLHIPTLWAKYVDMWKRNFHLSSGHLSSGYTDQKCKIEKASVAQIWACIALGICFKSHDTNNEGRHSAGWSLYRAAADLHGDPLSSFHDCPNTLTVLQNLVLMVLYHFRLEMNQRAENLLALAVSHAHYLGLHRSKTIGSGMLDFRSEMCRRLWWCLYVLDRRIAIDTGHPFLIHDINVDTPLPQELSDDWIFRYQEDSSAEPGPSPRHEKVKCFASPVPYLTAMVTYSKVLGKVWESLYGAKSAGTPPSVSLCQHLEQMLFLAEKDIRPEFTLRQSGMLNTQLNQVPRWQVKQQMLMRARWLSLRLLIRKPMLQRPMYPRTSALDTYDNEGICIRVASSLIKGLKQLHEQHVVYTFPFFHYLISAAVISLGLIIKEPTFMAQYGNVSLQAARLLEANCQTTWVSGNMLRTVSRLNHIASWVLNGVDVSPSAPQQSSNTLQAPVTRDFRGHFSSTTRPVTEPTSFQRAANSRSAKPLIQPDNENSPDEPAGAEYNSTCLQHPPFRNGPLQQAKPTNQNVGLTSPTNTTNITEETSPWLSRQTPAQTPALQSESENGEYADMKWLRTLFGDYLDQGFII